MQHLAVNTIDDKIFAEPNQKMENAHTQNERTRAKVVTCGIMIGSALFFPLANTEEPWVRVL